MLTITNVLQDTKSLLPVLEAEVLLAETLGLSRVTLHAHPELELTVSQVASFKKLIQRRLQGEPIAYITGYREFWSLPLQVSPATLIPRPETELLVELVLEKLPLHCAQQIADLGTGCGAIALAIAKECPLWQIWGIDRDIATLQIAKNNAERLSLTNNTQFLISDWYSVLPSKAFTAIVANPPYIAASDPHLAELNYEPVTALISADQGFADLKQIIRLAPDYLLPGGWLFLEHGYQQGEKVVSLLLEAGFINARYYHDLAGHPRVSLACLPA